MNCFCKISRRIQNIALKSIFSRQMLQNLRKKKPKARILPKSWKKLSLMKKMEMRAGKMWKKMYLISMIVKFSNLE
jgi:hypothetical protein